MSLTNKFPTFLRTRMSELGMKSYDLAQEIGASETFVSKWRHGRLEPSGFFISKLARALKVESAEIISRLKDDESKKSLEKQKED